MPKLVYFSPMKTFRILTLLVIAGCSSSPKSKLTLIKLENPPIIEREILAGGFSGLHFARRDGDKIFFYTHTDRGPNEEPIYSKKWKAEVRPFLLPHFQPRIYLLEANLQKNTMEIISEIKLTDPQKNPLSGLPNFPSTQEKKIFDELGVDKEDNILSADENGMDLEGIVQAPDKTFWMVEEYRPSLCHFDSLGHLLERYIPEGKKLKNSSSILPALFAERKLNRGFEGVAYDNGKLYAFLQSPTQKKSLQIPILEFDPTSKKSQIYTYNLENQNADKIGDAVALGNKSFLVIEQNSKVSKDSIKKVFKIKIEGKIIKKTLLFDLAHLGYDFADKIEGITVIDQNTIAVVNDNDFSSKETVLAIINLEKPLF